MSKLKLITQCVIYNKHCPFSLQTHSQTDTPKSEHNSGGGGFSWINCFYTTITSNKYILRNYTLLYKFAWREKETYKKIELNSHFFECGNQKTGLLQKLPDSIYDNDK